MQALLIVLTVVFLLILAPALLFATVSPASFGAILAGWTLIVALISLFVGPWVRRRWLLH
jgi:polyferredoxin